jgi:hypothetical protein
MTVSEGWSTTTLIMNACKASLLVGYRNSFQNDGCRVTVSLNQHP